MTSDIGIDRKILSILAILLVLMITSISGCTNDTEMSAPRQSDTVEITDMLGRNLTVPSEIDRVVATSSPSTILVYMLAPEKLAGWSVLNDYDNMFMNESYLSLPVLGAWFGAQTANYETVISLEPDIVIEGYITDINGQVSEETYQRQEMLGGIPVVAINGSFISVNSESANPTIEYSGKLLGCEEQAEALVDFRTSILNEIDSKVSGIPEEDKIRVYYAEGPVGLKTDPSGSLHSQVIDICGGINVADCPFTPGTGMTPVSMEQIMKWDPEIIITSNSKFYGSVYSDPLWENVDAVKNKQIYLAPQNPFCWIDRPQGPHLIIGTAWTATVLYPDLFEDMDMEEITREFYSQFLHYDLTDNELDMLLYPETGV